MAVAVSKELSQAFVPPKEEGQFIRAWKRFRKHKRGLIGLTILLLLALGIIFIPMFSPFSYKAQNVFQPLAPAGTISQAAGLETPGGYTYWLGTDDYGRDVLTRLFYGGRITLSVAVMSAMLVVLVGSIVGAVAGYFGGPVDSGFMRVTDFLMAFPLVPTFLLLTKIFPIGAHYSGGIRIEDKFMTVQQAIETAYGYSLIFVILGWMPISRQVRASIMSLKTLDFVEAAKALGASSARIITKHLVPNSVGPIVLAGILAVGDFIIYETILSYLGMGVGTPIPSWGNLVRDAQPQMWFITDTLNPMQDIRGFLVIMPGVLILLAVLAINLIGDAARDAFSPQ